jgi:hypothetical protein
LHPPPGYGQHDRKIHLQGTITCSQPVQAGINGEASETTPDGTASAFLNFFTQTCSPTPTKWKIKVASETEAPFAAGEIQVALTASAIDDFYTRYHDNARFIFATDTFSGTVIARPGG